MLYGQLSGARSLREIEAGKKSHANRFYHLGVRPSRRSTLAEANMDRPASMFSDLFAFLVSRLQRGRTRRALAGASTYLEAKARQMFAQDGLGAPLWKAALKLILAANIGELRGHDFS